MKWVALITGLLWLYELPRDLYFLQGADGRLQIGLSLKLGTGLLACLGLWRGSAVASAFLVVWCLQGMLMSVGEWLGQGPNPASAVSLAVRAGLLVWWTAARVIPRRKEVDPA